MLMSEMNYESRGIWFKHSIFKKENTMLRLLGCTLIRGSSRRRYPNFIDIFESYKGRLSSGQIIWLSLKFEK